MSKLENIRFWFSAKDPAFLTKNVVVQDEPNYISHAFVNCPIYNFKSSVYQKMGYKVSDDYVQETDAGVYIIRLNNTYYFDEDKSTISWQYVFESDTPEIYYPVGIPAISNIISGTGKYVNAKGTVTLVPQKDGKRIVHIRFTK